ncbi:MAG: AsmA family protein [Isosphaeraceae bacterium]
MRSRIQPRLALLLAILLPAIGVAVWYWVIPAVIVAAIRERHEGYVSISGWWIGGSSAGVTGLVLHEKPNPDSPTWAAADRVSTDLSIWGLLRGRMTPARIVFDGAKIHYRIDTDGAILTQLPLKQSQGATPEIIVRNGELTMAQKGRPEMVVHGMNGKLSPSPQGPPFVVDADDPGWGHPHLDGRFSPDFTAYKFQLTCQNLPSDLEKARRVPFVEEKIWAFVQPDGPIGVVLDFAYTPPPKEDRTATGKSDVLTTVNFEGTTVVLPTLQLRGEDARGRLSVKDKNVQLENVTGQMAGGRVTFTGPMDFKHKPDRYDLSLDLDDVNLTELPASWQLHRLGVRGRFTGTAGLRLVLTKQGLDMTGTTGDGLVQGAEIRGIPLKTLGIKLRGQGLRNRDEGPGVMGGGEPGNRAATGERRGGCGGRVAGGVEASSLLATRL